MAENTAIEWATHTFNPWEGCQKVGPGCDNCYAEARNLRFSGGQNWGPGAPRRLTSPMKLQCYRHEAKPSWQQAYSDFQPEPGKDRCNSFLVIQLKRGKSNA